MSRSRVVAETWACWISAGPDYMPHWMTPENFYDAVHWLAWTLTDDLPKDLWVPHDLARLLLEVLRVGRAEAPEKGPPLSDIHARMVGLGIRYCLRSIILALCLTDDGISRSAWRRSLKALSKRYHATKLPEDLD